MGASSVIVSTSLSAKPVASSSAVAAVATRSSYRVTQVAL